MHQRVPATRWQCNTITCNVSNVAHWHFLTGRSQVVRMGNNTSSPLTLNTGAPQGCVLSPLLYSLYTHDCTATHSSNVIVKFADDTTVIGLITDNDETAYRAEVSTLTKWCQENHLSLNIDKTKELVVDFRRQSREHTPITIDKTPVERVNSFKFSDGPLTQMQCWRRHINASSSWDGWGSLEWAPASSDHSTHALWRASWPAASPPGLETAPLATAKLCTAYTHFFISQHSVYTLLNPLWCASFSSVLH